MQTTLKLAGYSPKTISAYTDHVRFFAEHFNQSPEDLEDKEIRDYLLYLYEKRNLSDSYINIAYSALRFLYETVLEREWNTKQIPRRKKQKKLPVVLDQSEVLDVIRNTNNLKHRTILSTIYSAGLRVSEAAHLKVEDIDSKRMQIRIENGKGRRDRYTLLSKTLLMLLRKYWRAYQPPYWLFPGRPKTKPISSESIQRIFRKASNKARINKRVTPHTFRHCFATHLLEAGTDLRRIQKLLGHKNIRSTSKYTHLAKDEVLKTQNPFDLVMEVKPNGGS